MIFFNPKKKNKRAKRKKAGAGRQRKAVYTCAMLLTALFFSIAIKTGYHCLMNADFLKVKKINIRGCSPISKKWVFQKTGVKKDENILTINLVKESGELERNPWIYKAVVKRSLPDTIEIQIQERKPIAVIKLNDFYLMDRHGDIFKKAEQHELNLPLLTGLSKEDLIKSSDEASRIINAAISLIDNLKGKKMLNGRDTKIEMDKVFGLTVVNATDNTKIFFGHDDYETKLALLSRIVDDLGKKGLSTKFININSVKKAYITLSKSLNGISMNRG